MLFNFLVLYILSCIVMVKGGNMKVFKYIFLVLILNKSFIAYSADTVEAFVVNLSEMNSQVRITDLVCDKILHDDLIDAKSNFPISLCKGEDGLGQVELFIKIGCTKNKTIVKKNVTDGKKIPFLPTK